MAFAWLIACFIVSASTAKGDGSYPDPHPGPVAWIEESWQVKPGKLRAFIDAYDSEISALAWRTAGYRGYSIVSSLPAEYGAPSPTTDNPIGSGDALIHPHAGIMLEGRIKTGRSIDFGSMFGRERNVIVIHHIEDWKDADVFKQRLADLYAADNPGKSLADELAASLYPLVDNVWESTYRLVKTSFPSTSAAPPGGRPIAPDQAAVPPSLRWNDSKEPLVWIQEYWDVKPERLEQFLSVYQNEVYSLIRQTPGYLGYSVMTSLPERGAGSASARPMLGGSDQLYEPRPGVMIGGDVRTDTSINIGALFHKTFNVTIVHYMQDWQSSDKFPRDFQRRYYLANGGGDVWKHWEQTLFPLVNNHWDTYYRIVTTTFRPDPPSQ